MCLTRQAGAKRMNAGSFCHVDAERVILEPHRGKPSAAHLVRLGVLREAAAGPPADSFERMRQFAAWLAACQREHGPLPTRSCNTSNGRNQLRAGMVHEGQELPNMLPPSRRPVRT